MSGVYIPGMQKPEKCDDCPLQTSYMICELSTCPLIPVPDHGRLVEADAVIEQIDEWLDTVGYATVGKGLSYYGELLGCIEDAPTIIPASRGDKNG